MIERSLFDEFERLRRFVRWDAEDQSRVRSLTPLLERHFDGIVEQFYEDLLREPTTADILKADDRVQRLKVSLKHWLRQLLSMEMTPEYVASRWRVGRRHVELEIPQVLVATSLGRLRSRLVDVVVRHADELGVDLAPAIDSLNKLIDLDQAIIEHAYELQYTAKQRQAVRESYESVLHREREFSEGLVELAQAIVLVLDRDGRIVRYNRYFADLTGCPLGEVTGSDWFDTFLRDEDRGHLRQLFQEMVMSGADSQFINAIVTRSGQERQISWSNKVLTDEHRCVVGVLAIGHDITELQRSQAKALQAERLAAIGRMSTGLAHESRNALQRIQANCEVLELELAGNASAQEFLSRIQKAGDHLRLLLDEVRSYAAEINLDLSTTTLAAAWREAWRLLEAAWSGRRVEFVEETNGVDLRLTADHFRLVQVFRNILENAIAARAEDPLVIVIAAESLMKDGEQMIRLRIRDNGTGMTEEQRQRIFEPFYTTKSKGTGLGMALVHRYIEAHGGQIEVGQSSAKGTELILDFPRNFTSPTGTSSKAAAWTA